MLYHYTDGENNIIGFYQIKHDHRKVAIKLSNLTGSKYELDENEQKYEDVGAFTIDTIIVKSTHFMEEYMDLIEYGFNIYITDY